LHGDALIRIELVGQVVSLVSTPSTFHAVIGGCIIATMLGNRTSEQWIAQYSTSHQHPVNRVCHTLGIPLILLSVAVFLASIFVHRLWMYALGLFTVGWIFQFIGHAFEGKPPEFLHDWRFLFVGVRWWWAKMNGKA
jgi:uncharacterized membrane protein YGL010W